MTKPLLVRHPGPYPTESLVGYALRLSENNGYLSPWNLCRLAGMRPRELQTAGARIEKLAAIANRSAYDLDHIGFTTPTNRRLNALLGHRLTPIDLNIGRPKLCPQCVVGKGFVEAHWHLELMVACPIHRCLATSCCPKCRKSLRWFRPGLLECDCGANLMGSEVGPVSVIEAGLLDLLRRKVLRETATQENSSSLPQDDLMAMSLRSMLTTIRVLAKYQLIAAKRTAPTSGKQIVGAACNVLIDWPTNFIGLLKDMGELLPADVGGGVGRQFGGIYRALFRNAAIESGSTEFMKVAFLDFAINHWGRGFVDHKIIQHMGRTAPKRFVTQSQFAAQIGIRQVTAARFLRSSTLSSRRVRCGRAERILVDTTQSTMPRISPGKIYRKREAAKRLGISVSALQKFKETGMYEISHWLPARAGFHELDLEAFSHKLFTLAAECSG